MLLWIPVMSSPVSRPARSEDFVTLTIAGELDAVRAAMTGSVFLPADGCSNCSTRPTPGV